MATFIEAYLKAPEAAVKYVGAQFAKEYSNGSATPTSIPLTAYMAEVVLPIIGETLFGQFANRQGDMTNNGSARFTAIPLPHDQAKGDQLDMSRFNTFDTIISDVYYNISREIPYTNENIMDWSLSGREGWFEKFISTAIPVVKKRIEGYVINLLIENAIDKEYEIPTAIDGQEFKDYTYPAIIAKLRKKLGQVRNLGIKKRPGYTVDAFIEGGLNSSNFGVIVSSDIYTHLNGIEGFRLSVNPSAVNAFRGGLEETGYSLDGFPVWVSDQFTDKNVNYMVLPTGNIASFGLGMSYMKSVFDKVIGSATTYVSNVEFQYGANIIRPWNELVSVSLKAASAAGYATGTVIINKPTQTSTSFTGSVTADASITDLVVTLEAYESKTGNTAVIASKVVTLTDGSYEDEITGLTKKTSYYVVLKVSSELNPEINSTVASTMFRTLG